MSGQRRGSTHLYVKIKVILESKLAEGNVEILAPRWMSVGLVMEFRDRLFESRD